MNQVYLEVVLRQKYIIFEILYIILRNFGLNEKASQGSRTESEKNDNYIGHLPIGNSEGYQSNRRARKTRKIRLQKTKNEREPKIS